MARTRHEASLQNLKIEDFSSDSEDWPQSWDSEEYEDSENLKLGFSVTNFCKQTPKN